MNEQARLQQNLGDPAIHKASSWILRIGVILSVAVMLAGLALSFLREHPSVAQMETQRFSGDFARIARLSLAGNGSALIELGIALLVLTPIMRVAGSMILFAIVEKDWFYSFVTLLVLAMTLLSFLFLR